MGHQDVSGAVLGRWLFSKNHPEVLRGEAEGVPIPIPIPIPIPPVHGGAAGAPDVHSWEQGRVVIPVWASERAAKDWWLFLNQFISPSSEASLAL